MLADQGGVAHGRLGLLITPIVPRAFPSLARFAEIEYPMWMSKSSTPGQKVARIEVHYEDGAKDVMTPVSRGGTQIPLFSWTRSTVASGFEGQAYSSGAVAIVLFQTALTRRLMTASPRDKDTLALARQFVPVWEDPDYASEPPNREEPIQ